MSSLTAMQKSKIERQMASHTRGDTWVGCRPVVMDEKRYDKKLRRRQGKLICQLALQN